jgi:hypothetical protein
LSDNNKREKNHKQIIINIEHTILNIPVEPSGNLGAQRDRGRFTPATSPLPRGQRDMKLSDTMRTNQLPEWFGIKDKIIGCMRQEK